MKRHVLSINCGSSSLKYALFAVDADGERAVQRGGVDRIGSRVPTHAVAVDEALAALEKATLPVPDAVSHRIVFGGTKHRAPALADETMLADLRALVVLAPLHLPPEIEAIDAVARRWPSVPQVACFDTAFHATLPEAAWRYALPAGIGPDVRRYGFHGISCEYVVATLGAAARGRVIVAHLGSGASLTAVKDGASIDTTMGFTPLGGLVMGTRPGDLDPGVVLHLLRSGYDAERLQRLFDVDSGLRALSETTADVRDLLARRATDPRAALALDVFCFSARRWVGAMAASLGGLDTLVFTGGIGEHAAEVRSAIARGLEHLGIRLDVERNARGDTLVSADGGPCTVRVIATDEERMLARHARALLG
ncbi:MAG TPA: acetate/propionate family kinase [Polyangiaceae bacterium]